MVPEEKEKEEVEVKEEKQEGANGLSAVPASEPTGPPIKTPEEMKELELEFRVACGAFHKGKAKANLSRAQAMIREGFKNVDAVDSDGWSGLFHACGEGHLQIVQFLIDDCKVNIDLQATDQCTPLWVTSFNGRRDVAQVS